MEIMRERQTVNIEEYALDFEWPDMPGAGFSFPCTKAGEILRDKMHPAGLKNLEKCLSGEYTVITRGVKDYSYTYHQAAQGRCSCGQMVELEGFTNTCDRCGLLYNMSGQSLVPRDQWEEPWEED